jgi:hypothetical protein
MGGFVASTSSLLNAQLRRHVAPALRSAGFSRVDARNGWAWQEHSILVFNIRAVGRHFSEVTGWPPGSIGAWLGVFFGFIPDPARDELKTDDDGKLLPAEFHCHLRTHLDRGLRQTRFTRKLANRVERKRRDIWWVEPDGSNAEEVAVDIAKSLAKDGLSWYRQCGDLQTALGIVERERDCLAKFHRAAHLARHICDRAKAERYFSLEAAEKERIERIQEG